MPEYQDAEASDHTKLTVAGSRDDGNTQKTPEYVRKMDIDDKNIDNNDNNTCRTIYEAIYAPYFGEVKLFPK